MRSGANQPWNPDGPREAPANGPPATTALPGPDAGTESWLQRIHASLTMRTTGLPEILLP